MARSTCPACGATVDVAELVIWKHGPNGERIDDPEYVALDTVEDPASEADRYMIVAHGPMRAMRVAEGATRGLPDHKYDCPGANAGRS